MQAEDEHSSGMTGRAGDIKGQGAKDGPDSHGDPVSPDNPNGQDGPGSSAGQGGPGIPDCQSISSSSEGQVVPCGPGNPPGPSDGGAVGDAAEGGPAVEQAPPAPGLGGDAAPGRAGEPEGRPLTFTLIVPFQNQLEAEIARRCLMSDVQRQVRKELTVTGSILVVRWTAENLAVLRLSMNSFLTHLSLVVRNIQCIGHPCHLNFDQEK
ncbi:uncharacterized protein LOC143670492 [Tamandua tetradactyla]|uniref:uncharacterized protein LOC143670492 n=1 Tax=Tamandua tetradactyla TaxID=48850 RepID=UPI00405455CC